MKASIDDVLEAFLTYCEARRELQDSQNDSLAEGNLHIENQIRSVTDARDYAKLVLDDYIDSRVKGASP